MSAIKVNFEIGHEASLRSKKTPEGFTHDWEVFVRGQEGADISHFVEKVVFHLHETFPKPRRAVKEPPFSIKESGYAGFLFPIEIYLKNKDEPKMIKFSYDLSFQRSGFLKDRYIFANPNEDFKKKLLKGGGIPVSNNAFYTNPDQESRSRDSFTEEKPQLVSKPKLSSENVKKHKSKEHKEEIPHRTSNFEHLFGPPIQKPPKVSPDPKKLEKTTPPAKSEKKEKERSNSDKKSKHEHKEAKPEKVKVKEDKDKIKSEKVKTHRKDQEKPKDKNKRQNERPPSPEAKKRCISPARRPPSPPPRSSSASSIKEEYKPPKQNFETVEQKKPKIEEKPPEPKVEKEVKEKKKKEKKSHDRDKERKEKKEHKKESHKLKESPKEPPKEIPKEQKVREVPKEKEPVKEIPTTREKPPKPEKVINKFSIENLRKTPPPEEERTESHKSKDKTDSERKHKHKKKDKKRDESREKHKESSKEKKHKHDKVRELPVEKPEIVERRETPVSKERSLPEPASPISIDTASQCSSKSGVAKISHIEPEDINSSHSDSEGSVIAEEEETKAKIENPSPEPVKHDPSPEPEPEPDPEPEVEPEPVVEAPPPQQKEKSKKHKDKSKKEEKRRKRKAAEDEDIENRKVPKAVEVGAYNETEHGESSGSTSVETKVQDNGVSSSLGEDAEPGDLSPDYMEQLRDLQQRIMKIKNNEDLERVVNLIAETGRYEVTTQTFDFDLCLLDRSTVQQLIQLVGC